MIGNYKVITLCGSTKFKNEFIAAQKELTLQGNIVINVGLFGHSGSPEAFKEETKLMLDDMHKRKIDMSDAIYVINKDNYIGSSTASEIVYASEHGKEINYLFDSNGHPNLDIYKDQQTNLVKLFGYTYDSADEAANAFCEQKDACHEKVVQKGLINIPNDYCKDCIYHDICYALSPTSLAMFSDPPYDLNTVIDFLNEKI